MDTYQKSSHLCFDAAVGWMDGHEAHKKSCTRTYGEEMEPGLNLLPVTRPDPTRMLLSQ